MITESPLKRAPAVAGSFYPTQPEQLEQMLDTLLKQAPATSTGRPKILIVPHAGYIYSGPVAASAYRILQDNAQTCERVVLLGPSHRVALHGLALSSLNCFSTPLGDIMLDHAQDPALLQLPDCRFMDEAHEYEHSLEVQLPFLQKTLGRFLLCPLVVGQAPATLISRVMDLLDDEQTLFVISSDLSHYHDYRSAQHIDSRTAEAILNFDYTSITPQMACGCHPLNGALLWARQHNMQIQLLDLRNSGDTAGDKNRVVGYASCLINEHAGH